jgi:hypothetical protein
MAQNVNARRIYIDVDRNDDHAVIRRVPVHQASWEAPEPVLSPAPTSKPVTRRPVDQVRTTPQRVSAMIRSVRKRQSASR